jgi:hypothetical protein
VAWAFDNYPAVGCWVLYLCAKLARLGIQLLALSGFQINVDSSSHSHAWQNSYADLFPRIVSTSRRADGVSWMWRLCFKLSLSLLAFWSQLGNQLVVVVGSCVAIAAGRRIMGQQLSPVTDVRGAVVSEGRLARRFAVSHFSVSRLP